MRDIGRPVSHRRPPLASSRPMTGARRAAVLVVPVVLALALAPFVWTAITQRSMTWTPVFDLAMIELRVRDTSVGRLPRLGLVGRIGTEAHVGSHPGPLAFYLLAPVYRLLGSSSWALQVAALVYHGAAVVVAVLLGRRRAGRPGAVAVAVLLGLVIQGYGMSTLAEPWNPFLPVLWFVVCLLAVWSVVAGDRPMLLVAVFAAAVCAQTHVPYLAMTTGLLGLGAAACLAAEGVRRPSVRRGLPWLAGAGVLGLVLWAPPLIEQVTGDERGNLSVLVDHFATPPEEPLGLRTGGRLLLQRLDLWHVVHDTPREPGHFIGLLHRYVPVAERGVVTAAAWALAAVASSVWLRPRRALVALHVVVGIGLFGAWLALSRIFGAPLYYLMLWVWSLTALAGIGVAWTLVELALRARPGVVAPERRRQVALGLTAVGVVVVAGLSLRLMTQPRPLPLGQASVGQQLGRLMPDTARGLDGRGGREGRWLVTWSDVAHLGSQGYGLVNELERRGFDVGVIEYHRWNFLQHRYLPSSAADGRVHLATGEEVARWEAVPGAVRLALDDPRTADEQERFDELRAQLAGEFAAAGWDDLVEGLDLDLWSTGSDPRISGFQALLIGEMRELGVPAAVYVVPVDAQP